MAVTISRTPASTGNQKTYTLSYWVKRGGTLGSTQQLWNCNSSIGGGTDYMYMRFMSTGTLYLESTTASSANISFTTDRIFRDPSAWYHIVLAVDTAQSVSTDRWKLYVNGAQETEFSASDYSTQDVLTPANKISVPLYIGTDDGGIQGFEGIMSHVQLVDGLALAPTEFGEVDSTSGIWKLKTTAYATPGTNGFYLKMEDRTNLDLDSSSNAFTFTTTGTLTATYDNPSNNFCTMNPLDNKWAGATFSNGNSTVATVGGNYSPLSSTYGLTQGKWYWELKQTSHSHANQQTLAGIAGDFFTSSASTGTSTQLGKWPTQYAFYAESGGIETNNADETYGTTQAELNDIIQCYIDLDNNKIYFAVNDTLGSSTGFDITAAASTLTQYYMPAVSYWSGTTGTLPHNFGNGYFGTTAVTSAVADAGGEGAFEYDPSRGGAAVFDGSAKDFRAICTKNLATYG